jgi:4-pyridoxate dehydrogenase
MTSRAYDYVIVGAGSAGCVAAARLGEDSSARILVIEAGGSDASPLIRVPLGVAKVWKGAPWNWSYQSEPEPHADGRSIYHPRGKVVGGSSSINMMAYVRGHRADFERWSASGLPGWSYAQVLPYFKRGEAYEDGPSKYRGGSGPVRVTRGRTEDPIYGAFLEAAPGQGYAVNPDYNGSLQEGFARMQFTASGGRRCSASVAYLYPAMARGNVELVRNALVTRVLMEGTRAVGVEYVRGGRREQVRAESEVILAGGSINTPQLLMLSGVGPSRHLKGIGLEVKLDAPAVGQNLQDHTAIRTGFLRSVPSSLQEKLRLDRLTVSMARAWCFGTGFAADPPGGMTAFVKSTPEQAIPDLQLFCTNGALFAREWFPGLRAPGPDGFAMRACHLRPQSRGHVELASRDPAAAPRILNNFLSTDADRRALRESIKFLRRVAASAPLKGLVHSETLPGPDVRTDDEIDAYVRKTMDTVYHPVGTCRMGSDDAAPVDLDFRLRGTDRLRVVDASVMPDLTGGNINAVVLMVAEKASDVIRKRAPLPAATGL